jgi:hypothetical protein
MRSDVGRRRLLQELAAIVSRWNPPSDFWVSHIECGENENESFRLEVIAWQGDAAVMMFSVTQYMPNFIALGRHAEAFIHEDLNSACNRAIKSSLSPESCQ